MRRTEALVATIQLQQAEERWRSANSRYGSLAEIGVAAIASGRNYLLSVVGASATGYTAVAQATGTQASDRQCRYMLLSVESGNLSDNSGETAAGSIDAQENRRRWNQ
jgi:type IV pilus assembly protein PilE